MAATLDHSTAETNQPLLVCLLPARNAEADLAGYLDCVSTFCDAVVALDDGSTDRTWQMLNAHPLVTILLRNPLREDYRGWDDAANRNRLLEAAESLNPEWLISLDADERLDAADAVSLRAFLQTDALPGCAYGFRHVPMRNDGEHFLPKYQWVYRVFSAKPGQRFPDQKLHFIPIPMSIPRYRWIRTTLRIQHFGGVTAERRLHRFHKYLEADPDRMYQADYAQLLGSAAEEELRRWQTRPDSVPVLLPGGIDDGVDGSAPVLDPAAPALSAIIISRNDERTIGRTVSSVVNQEVPEPFEVIVVVSGTDGTAGIVRENFPSAAVVELGESALPGAARNAGLAVARGSVITFPGSHVELLPGSLAARLHAHRRGYAMVTGTVYNGTMTPAGWASYFLDQFQSLPGLGAAEFDGPPAHCSYARLPLLEVGGFPEGVRTGEDTAVNRAMVARGYVAYRDPEIEFIHHSPCTTVPRLVRHHFRRGQGWGRILIARYRECGGMLTWGFVRARLVEEVPTRLLRIEASVQRADPAIIDAYRRTRRLVALGAVATWLGMWYELLRPTTGKLEILLGRPVVNLLVFHRGAAEPLHLVQIDHVSGETTARDVSPDLLVRHEQGTGALGALIGAVAQSDRGLAEVREAVRSALHVDHLECVVFSDGGMLLPGGPGPDREPGQVSLGRRLLVSATTSVVLMQGLARQQVRSTLPLWRTVRAVERIQALKRKLK